MACISLIWQPRSWTQWFANCMPGLDHMSWAPSTTTRATLTPPQKMPWLLHVDLSHSAWTCLRRPASCWAMLGLMNKRPPKRRRIGADSAAASLRELRPCGFCHVLEGQMQGWLEMGLRPRYVVDLLAGFIQRQNSVTLWCNIATWNDLYAYLWLWGSGTVTSWFLLNVE